HRRLQEEVEKRVKGAESGIREEVHRRLQEEVEKRLKAAEKEIKEEVQHKLQEETERRIRAAESEIKGEVYCKLQEEIKRRIEEAEPGVKQEVRLKVQEEIERRVKESECRGKEQQSLKIVGQEEEKKAQEEMYRSDEKAKDEQLKYGRSHSFEKQYFDETRDLIFQEIQLKRDKIRSRDLGGGDAYANAILRDMAYKSIKLLETQYASPYFGRVDFVRKGSTEIETYYIGKHGLEEKNIISWTVGASSIFYQKRLGTIQHETLGEIRVELIRQFDILSGSLKDFHDLVVTENGYFDPILHQALGENSGGQLGDIVKTIQTEQDNIIRLSKNIPILVQGSAGSGKTTVALHRLPYLFYKEPDLNPEGVLLFGPNKMFLKYIEKVLPDTGVNGIEQTTFDDWVKNRIKLEKSGYVLSDYYENINIMDRLPYEQKHKLFIKSKLKGSLLFKNALGKFLDEIKKQYIPNEAFELNFDEFTFAFSREDLHGWFHNDFKRTEFAGRREKILKRLKNKLDSYCTEKGRGADIYMQEKIKVLRQKFLHAVKEYNAKWTEELNIYEIYYRFITNKKHLTKYLADSGILNEEELDFLIRLSNIMYSDKKLEYEDLAPLLFIYQTFYGNVGMLEPRQFSNRKYSYTVVDEVQDYSLFQLEMIVSVTNTGCIILVGDLGQSIHSYRGIDSWEELRNLSFEKELQYMELSTSYRSTIEITEKANAVMLPFSKRKFVLSKPVGRSGKETQVIQTDDGFSMLYLYIKNMLERNILNIAVIVRGPNDVYPIYTFLEGKIEEVTIFTDHDNEYSGGVVIMPVYLTKGLEFDGVVIFNASAHNYTLSDHDRKLLYVAMTRALHELYIICPQTMTKLL
ncbi:UvrD-helicase domain-containing protein, partial [Bacillus cereus]|nr:UvrD-helicase domain-containing protein [Bacillus cereus]